MVVNSEKLINSRREEIINACVKLYETMSFKDITIKEIGNATSFTRTSIYNYFKTKEEIFLAIMQREYEYWIRDINSIRENNNTMSKNDFASAIAHSLEERPNLLKLLSMNLFDMEENSSMEALVNAKLAFGNSMRAISECLEKFFDYMTKEDIDKFIFSFFPFMYGIYPYTVVTDKQIEAMDKANVPFVYMSIYDMTYTGIMMLLKEA